MATETHDRVAPRFGRGTAAPEPRRHGKAASAPPAGASAPPAARRPLRPSPRPQDRRRRLVSPLTVRILALNIPALGILLGGALFLGQYREGLVDSKIASLRTQGEIIAGAVGEAAVVGEVPGIDPDLASALLVRLVAPLPTRARLFAAAGDLVADSQDLGPAAREVEARDLPPPEPGGLGDAIAGALDWVLRVSVRRPRLPLYREAYVQVATDYGEAVRALGGEPSFALREMSGGDTIVSVAIPVQRFKQVVGVLLVSTVASDIEQEVADVRVAILQVFGVALAVTVLLSAYLAGTIARPIRRLAEAADGAEYRTGRRNVIPDFTGRKDEIGELSRALRAMTDALYERLDAIEAFAADVAHEIKNPLSSIQSAAETLSRTTDVAQRDRLMHIIIDDIHRLDRLITDVSDASRLGAELARAERTSADLLEMARTLADIHRETGDQAPAIEVRAIGAGPFAARCIEDRIGQVLRNLLANAVSFSPPGGRIGIELRRFGGLVEVAVEDDGPGVPDDKLEAVFDRFYSLRPGDEPFGAHSGLGLSISRQILEAHGGTLHVENRRDAGGAVRGARFVAALPAA